VNNQKPDPAEMESALKVISTWASVPGALDAKHVRNLCDKALRRRPLDQVHQMLQDEARCGHGGSQQITHAETINAELATPGAVAAGAGAVEAERTGKDSLTVDAERYRWLRKNCYRAKYPNSEFDFAMHLSFTVSGVWSNNGDPVVLDACIDTEMQKEPKP
jgi:hypothetical protein